MTMSLSEEEIRKILKREICHPDFQDEIHLEPFGFSGDYFCSLMFRAKVTLKKNAKEQNVLVKIPPPLDPNFKDFTFTNYFNNECFMYGECIPEMFENQMDLFPEIYFISENLLVIEDLSVKGYKLGPKKELDFAHFKIALQNLGLMHAASLAFKAQYPDRFNKMASKLQNINGSFFSFGSRVMGLKAIDWFCSKYPEKVNEVDIENLKKAFMNVDESMVRLKEKFQEPWNVICHGDFNRNNMLFRYDNEGNPVDVKFIDLQTAIRTSPIIDLSFFIFLNSTYQTRSKHGAQLMNIYFSQIEDQMGKLNLLETYNRKLFDHEFASKAFYGVLIVSWFIFSVMANPEELKKIEFNPEDEETWNQMSKVGGKDAQDRTADIIREFVEKKYWPVQSDLLP